MFLPCLFHRFYRCGILLSLLLPILLHAQPNPGSNQITIELVSEDFQCATGQLTVRFRIKNENLDGLIGRYTSSFHIQSGSHIEYGSASNNNVVHEFTLPHVIGNIVTIGAYGIIDNDAAYVEYSFNPSAAQLPDPPSISTASAMPLCNGASAVLVASGSTGSYIWSNGATGTSITVTAAGIYTARATNSCGQSSPSNSITVSTDAIPSAPTVTPSGSQTLCNGESITLSASGSNISWSTGATGNSITTSTAGSYYAVSSNGCGNSAISNVVNIATVTCPTPLPGSSFFVCPGSSKTLDAGAGYDTYLWSTGATTRTITVGPGTYTVTVTKDGCPATSAPVTVSYYTVATPTISASGALQFCSGGTVTLSSSAANNYLWNTGATSAAISVSSSGVYYVTTTDANGCQATSAATTVTVNPLPTASISGGGSLCQNGGTSSVTFTGSGGTAPYTFSYRINGGSVQTISTSGGNSVTIQVPSSSVGVYTYSLVSVRESSATQCVNSASGEVTVTVNALPTATISGSASVCSGATAPIVTFSGSGGTAPYVFTYEINGGAYQTISSTGSTATIAVNTATAGTFTYRLVSVRDASSTACTSIASGTATVVVNPMPLTPVIQTSNTHLCNGASTTIQINNHQVGITYQWYRNGSLYTTSTASSISVTTAGSYTVRAVSAEGCTTVISAPVTITTGTVVTPVITGIAKVCIDGKTRLSVGAGYERIQWQDASTGLILGEGMDFFLLPGSTVSGYRKQVVLTV